jgi:hypothetical protein
MRTIFHDHTNINPASAIERLGDHLRWPTLPWPARRLARRHGLHAATAATIAELIGYTTEAR